MILKHSTTKYVIYLFIFHGIVEIVASAFGYETNILFTYSLCYDIGNKSLNTGEFNRYGFSTVSYTHLDVYKRQDNIENNIK